MNKFTKTLKHLSTVTLCLMLALLVTPAALAQDLLWKANFTGTGNNTPYFSAIDGNNNIYVLSAFNGSCTTPTPNLNSFGGNDIAISKYDASGSYLWSQQIGGTSADLATGIAISSDNSNIYVTGYFQNTAAGLTSTGGMDGFIAKYNSSGKLIWFKDIAYGSSSTNQRPNMIKVDKNNNIIIAGWYFSDITLGNNQTNYSFSTTQPIGLFIAKFDTSGTVINAKSIETSSVNSKFYTFDVDTSGYYFTGWFNGSLITDLGTKTSLNNSNDIFIYKTDFSFNSKWILTASGSGNDQVYSCSAGNNGYFYIGGQFASSSLTVDSTASGLASLKSYKNTTSDGKTDIFFAKYSSNGVLQWFNTAGSAGTDYLYRALYKNGDFIAAGQYGGSMTFNNKTITPKDNADAFAIVQDQNDNLKYLMSFGGIGTDIGETSVVDNNGNFVVIGDYTSSKLYLRKTQSITDSLTNSNAGTTDMFIAKYDKASLSFVASSPKCNNSTSGSITVSAEGTVVTPYTYAWSKKGDASYSASTATISGLSAGTYYVTFTDGVNYTKTDSVVLSSPSAISLVKDSVKNVSCYNGSNGAIYVTASGGTTPYSYAWTTSGANVQATNEDQTALTKGTYNLTVTDKNYCTATLTDMAITQPKAITFAGSTATRINGSTGSVDVTVSGGTPSYTYLWEGPSSYSATTEDISGITTAGDYMITVTDANSCTGDTTFYIANSHVMNAYLGSKVNIKCKGESTGEIHIETLNVAGTASYAWTPSVSTSADATGLSAGKYYVTVTDNADNSTSEVIVTLTEPSTSLSVSLAASQITCHDAGNGILDANAAGGTLPYTYTWTKDGSSFDGGNETVTGLSEGSYAITATDGNGCQATASATITNATAITFDAAVTNVTCDGNKNDGSVTLSNVAGGTGAFSYKWSNGVTTQNATLLASGDYYVTITDGNNCTATGSYTVSAGSSMSASFTVTDPTCNGSSNGSLSATISGGTSGYSYSWSTGSTSSSISSIAAGTYTVTVTDANKCYKSFSAVVSQPDALTFSTQQNNVSCYGYSDGSIVVWASGGTPDYSYEWNNQLSSTCHITGMTAGTYSVTATDANSCTGSVTFTITEPDALSISSITSTDPTTNSPYDGQIEYVATGGTSPYTYTLCTGSSNSTGTFTGLEPGSYYATITDKNSCGPVVSSSLTLSYATLVTDIISGTKVYPNPASEYLYVEMGSVDKTEYKVQLVTLNGTLAFSQIISAGAMQNAQLKINVSGIAKGLYILKVNGTVVSQKVVIE